MIRFPGHVDALAKVEDGSGHSFSARQAFKMCVIIGLTLQMTACFKQVVQQIDDGDGGDSYVACVWWSVVAFTRLGKLAVCTRGLCCIGRAV